MNMNNICLWWLKLVSEKNGWNWFKSEMVFFNNLEKARFTNYDVTFVKRDFLDCMEVSYQTTLTSSVKSQLPLIY